MKKIRAYAFLSLILVAGCFTAAAQVPRSSHVVVVAEENHSYYQATHNMPKLMSLLSKYGIAANFYAVTHPSIGNYFDLTTGQVITNNDSYSSTVKSDNIVRHFLSSSTSWKVYAESLPYDGYLGGDRSPYIKHHNPFAYFSDVQSSQRYNIQQFQHFAEDVQSGNLPEFSFVVPNQYHNAHNGTLGAADDWLQSNVISKLLQTPEFQPGGNGLLVIWFDESYESDGSHGGGHILVGLIGPQVKAGYKDTTFYQHPSLMKTILKALGASTSGLSKIGYSSTPVMSNLFKSSSTTSNTSTTQTSSTALTVSSPVDGGTYSSPLHVIASDGDATHMAIYVDYNKVYGQNSQKLDTYLTLSTGDHRVVVQDWNQSGQISKYVANVHVGGTATVGSLTVWSPLDGQTLSSPVHVKAADSRATHMKIYVDNVEVYGKYTQNIDTYLKLSSGGHKVTVQDWNTSGTVTKYSAQVSVR